MAAVQGGQVDAVEEKDIKTEPSNDGGGNNNANDGRLLSTSPGSSSSTGSIKSAAGPPEDQQTLLAVLQFLRKNKLTESVEILRREAGLPEDSLDLKGGDSSGAGSGAAAGSVELAGGDASSLLSRVTSSASAVAPAPTKAAGEDQPDVNVVLSAYSQQGDPPLYQVYYSGLKKFIESVLDCHRAELSQVFYPLFVHMYLELVYNNHESEAKAFFEKFSGDQECYYEDDLRILSSLSKREHMRGNETLLDFRTSKFVLRISRDSYQLLKRHLQERQNNQIWNIIQEHLYIDIFDGMPRSKSQIDAMSGSLAGEGKREANKAKVYYGLLKEPEIELPLDDEDEEAENEEGKPKKKKPKKDSMGSKSKKQDPNAPAQTRIPLPELKDSDKLDKIMYMKEATKRIRLGPEILPSICFYTFLNAYQKLRKVKSAAGTANDRYHCEPGLMLFGPSITQVSLSQDLNLIDKESDDVLERIMDEKTASELKILYGHSGPVYGISFSPDSLWATDHYQPLRIFSGHLADVTCTRFHPNSNYVATGSSDRTIRVWDVLTGNCVRIFTGHKGPIHSLAFSPNGKFLASGATDSRVLLWDIGHGLMIGELKGHTDTVYSLRFSRDGEILASGSMDNTVRLWNATKAFDDLETDDFTAATGHVHLHDNSQELLLGAYTSKSTPVIHLHFTRRNLLLAAGGYNP
ncbi:hypothetical protein F7725_016042 [Dissostichus mawsoni]|uniref:Transcription initiation factor TFIID subunit 5 n=1 Tax=Dissostichus mawsoni TaxID=36200 RepID=A0A7J5Y3H4_DISMA|nr:hypothetical protein F7725_016042 [Dissostichus mawsoni]